MNVHRQLMLDPMLSDKIFGTFTNLEQRMQRKVFVVNGAKPHKPIFSLPLNAHMCRLTHNHLVRNTVTACCRLYWRL